MAIRIFDRADSGPSTFPGILSWRATLPFAPYLTPTHIAILHHRFLQLGIGAYKFRQDVSEQKLLNAKTKWMEAPGMYLDANKTVAKLWDPPAPAYVP
jgi:hypothetical protein